jgi:hypothetical protein
MPNFPWPGRRDVSAISDASLSALLAGAELPAGSPPGLRPVAEALAALTAAPAGDELTGEAEALAVFRDRLGVPSPTRRPRRRPALLAPLLSARAAAAAAVAALGIGGFATAAFAGALPAPAQQFAHHTIGAPAAHASQPTSTHASQPTSTHPSATDTPAGPDATGPAAFGLCTAWTHAKEHGTTKQKAVAFRNLAQAAGGAGNVADYCAAVPHPGASSSHASHPTGPPTSHPTGPPTSHPTGPPTSHPTPHATGKP